jgi:hypothetical protein
MNIYDPPEIVAMLESIRELGAYLQKLGAYLQKLGAYLQELPILV